MDIYVIWAGLLGALSAMSLLIGSLIGVGMRLPRAAVGMLAAFGAVVAVHRSLGGRGQLAAVGAVAATIWPGVQAPHWRPPSRMNASWSGLSEPSGLAMPSTVVMARPSSAVPFTRR